MKRYIKEAGFIFREDHNDLTNRQFSLTNVTFINSEQSTLGTLKLDREESYTIFIKDFEPSNFKAKLESIINSAIRKGVNVTLSNTGEVEKVENGYTVALSFYIQG